MVSRSTFFIFSISKRVHCINCAVVVAQDFCSKSMNYDLIEAQFIWMPKERELASVLFYFEKVPRKECILANGSFYLTESRRITCSV